MTRLVRRNPLPRNVVRLRVGDLPAAGIPDPAPDPEEVLDQRAHGLGREAPALELPDPVADGGRRVRSVDPMQPYAPGDAAVHAEAAEAAATDWRQIVGLYDALTTLEPSPVVELNRAVAVAMCDGPEAGLALVDALLARGELADYHLSHAARADFLRRLGRTEEARAAYGRALELVRLEPERRFLERRLRELAH